MDAFNRKRHENCGFLKASIKMNQMMNKKIKAAVDFASKASIYNVEDTTIELTTAQSILLSLMHSLLNNDMGFCINLLELGTTIDHLRSSYLPTWLKDDFNFVDHQVIQIISKTALLVRSGLFPIPSHIVKVFVGLAPKYKVVEYCRSTGNTDVLKFLEEFGIYASSNSSSPNQQPAPTTLLTKASPNSCLTEVCQSLVFQAVADRNGTAVSSGNWSSNDVVYLRNPSEFVNEAMNSVERIETPYEEVQEVWIEGSETVSALPETTSLLPQATNLGGSAAAPYVATVKKYLKLPDDFEEEELLKVINYADSEGITPLHNAVKEGDAYIVECMLELGAKVDAADTFGYAPCHCAASTGSVPAIQVLAQHNANLSLAMHDGCTPLHVAIINGNTDFSKWLLTHGVDINVRNADGWGPLHLAAQWDQLEITKLLIDNGADVGIYNNNGKTAIDIAREEGHISILQLLSAKIN